MLDILVMIKYEFRTWKVYMVCMFCNALFNKRFTMQLLCVAFHGVIDFVYFNVTFKEPSVIIFCYIFVSWYAKQD